MRRRRNWSTKRPTRWWQRLSQQKDLFHSIEQPKGGSFFAQNGLLFEKTSDLAPQMKMLTQAQRLVQVLAGDPSLRGVIQALQFGLLGVQGGQITLDNMTWPMTLAANTIEKVNAGQPASFSWHELVAGPRLDAGRAAALSANPGFARLFRARTRASRPPMPSARPRQISISPPNIRHACA